MLSLGRPRQARVLQTNRTVLDLILEITVSLWRPACEGPFKVIFKQQLQFTKHYHSMTLPWFKHTFLHTHTRMHAHTHTSGEKSPQWLKHSAFG